MKSAFRSIGLLITACSIGACSSDRSSSTPIPQAREVIAKAPVISSRGPMRKYANLFKSACLDQSPAFAETATLLTANGFKPVNGTLASSGNRQAAFSDGTAYASLIVNSRTNNVCTVALKTNDDDPLLAEFRRVVSSSQFASGNFSQGGLFGASYILRKGSKFEHIISLGRQSGPSPTILALINAR